MNRNEYGQEMLTILQNFVDKNETFSELFVTPAVLVVEGWVAPAAVAASPVFWARYRGRR